MEKEEKRPSSDTIKIYDENYVPDMYDENLNFGLDEYFSVKDSYNILFCARSRAGKGILINNLFV